MISNVVYIFALLLHKYKNILHCSFYYDSTYKSNVEYADKL